VTSFQTHQEFINRKNDPKTCNHATNPPLGISLLAPGTGSRGMEFVEPDDEPSSDSFPVFGSLESGVESMVAVSFAC
jgi:hypothetical protein